MNKIVWFRYDLRLIDNDAFLNAIKNGNILPIFIFDKSYFKSEISSSFHLKFITDSLIELDNKLQKDFGTNLNIYYGDTLETLKKIVDKFKINEVFSNKIFKNKLLNNLDTNLKTFFISKKIKWNLYNQFGIQLNHRERYKWSANWNKFINSGINTGKSNCKFLFDQKLTNFSIIETNQFENKSIQKGGRKYALELLDSFLESRSENYQKEMSSPISGEKSCSRLSPHITYGNISLKEIYNKTKKKINSIESYSKKKSLLAFKSRLAWHCHFIQKLYDEPEIEFANLNKAYDGLRENDFNQDYFLAWKEGKTGFPFVDACMRYLIKTGWINFRMRAMLVSFASYQLWLDWKKTSKHMAKLFTDYEPGIHYSQFQMQSGTTGINSIRIYNPIKQSFDQDVDGKFIRKWVPELRSIPEKLVHEPWKLTYLDQKGLGIKIGTDYPFPIIDNITSTKLAKDKIWRVKNSIKSKILSKEILNKHASLSLRR